MKNRQTKKRRRRQLRAVAVAVAVVNRSTKRVVKDVIVDLQSGEDKDIAENGRQDMTMLLHMIGMDMMIAMVIVHRREALLVDEGRDIHPASHHRIHRIHTTHTHLQKDIITIQTITMHMRMTTMVEAVAADTMVLAVATIIIAIQRDAVATIDILHILPHILLAHTQTTITATVILLHMGNTVIRILHISITLDIKEMQDIIDLRTIHRRPRMEVIDTHRRTHTTMRITLATIAATTVRRDLNRGNVIRQERAASTSVSHNTRRATIIILKAVLPVVTPRQQVAVLVTTALLTLLIWWLKAKLTSMPSCERLSELSKKRRDRCGKKPPSNVP